MIPLDVVPIDSAQVHINEESRKAHVNTTCSPAIPELNPSPELLSFLPSKSRESDFVNF
jgi:hypothetical protein